MSKTLEGFCCKAEQVSYNFYSFCYLPLFSVSEACFLSLKCEQAPALKFFVFKVIESVEQTGTSLQRFKRKGTFAGGGESSSADSDEGKIRTQLFLDLMHFKNEATVFDLDFTKLDLLISRSNGSTGGQKADTLSLITDVNSAE